MRKTHSTCLAAILLTGSVLVAQSHPSCMGNGLGQAYIQHGLARIGDTLDIEVGSPASPGGIGLISVSDGLGPTVFPGPQLGTLCSDIFSAAYFTRTIFFDAGGVARLQVPIPADPSLEQTSIPLFLKGLAVEGPLSAPTFSLTNTVRLAWANPDSYAAVPSLMQEARSMHTATSLHRFPGDHRTRVLITGGGGGNFMQPDPTATTELYEPLTRTFVPGPAMTVPRAAHRATMLQDGRILITGGATTGRGGTVVSEIFDPTSDTFTRVADMNRPRLGHEATLLNDGRIFVSGGFITFADAITQFGVILNWSQRSAEIYDPIADTWTLVGDMADDRAGHTQLLLADGRVLIFGGINGGVLPSPFSTLSVPTFNGTTEIYDPFTDAFTVAGTMSVARAFCGATYDGSTVLATGGFVSGPPQSGAFVGPAIASRACEVFDGATWTSTADLPGDQAFHRQVRSPRSGNALTFGGFIGDLILLAADSHAFEHDGTNVSALAPLGTNLTTSGLPFAAAHHRVTLLADGSYLITGGAHQLIARDDAWIYTER